MSAPSRNPALVGIPTGIIVALSFALIAGLVPDDAFLQPGLRTLVYALAALAGPPTVALVRAIARLAGSPQGTTTTWAIIGAITFDGLAIGTIPGLYGHSGQALAWLASTLLFAFACVLISNQLMPVREAARRG